MKIFLALLISVNAFATIKINHKLTGQQKGTMVKYLKYFVEKQKMAGLVAAATRGDEVIWYSGYGKANVAKNEKLSATNHMFRWASVSKVSTDAFARAMQDMGALKLDDRIDKYYNFANPKYYKRCFTSSTLNKLFNCGKTYGFEYPLNNIRGTCFDVKSFKTVDSSKGYKIRLNDKSASKGSVEFMNKKGEVKCKANYNITIATLDMNKYPITLRHLITHKAGVQHYSYLGNKSEPPKHLISNVQTVRTRRDSGKSTMEWALKYFFPKHPLLAKPGKAYSYSTFGHNLAGVVIEKATAMTFQQLIELYAGKMGAKSMQVDYFRSGTKNNYPRAYVHRLSNGKVVNNPYVTDNSYKVTGGGIMSTIPDLARFCAAISKDKYIMNKGFDSYTHSGAHPDRSASLLVLKNAKDDVPQCLVLMTNTNHDKIDLDKIRKFLAGKLVSYGVWKKYNP
jgi:CubicO group peptidase (beta-lactamase class C family)